MRHFQLAIVLQPSSRLLWIAILGVALAVEAVLVSSWPELLALDHLHVDKRTVLFPNPIRTSSCLTTQSSYKLLAEHVGLFSLVLLQLKVLMTSSLVLLQGLHGPRLKNTVLVYLLYTTLDSMDEGSS